MADQWFEIAGLDHFWVRRRFEAFQKLAGRVIANADVIAEVGCGHGLLQRQLELAYKKEIIGFDLNEFALKRNLSDFSRLYCYDIYRQADEFRGQFDLILLFDVLEHIAEEDLFLKAVVFHLAPAGCVAINVPAGEWAFSKYDRAAGHVRRYSVTSMRKAAMRNGLRVNEWTYWGLPLLPILALRKAWLSGRHDQDEIISSGFESRSSIMNESLHLVSRLEPIPQNLAGTSLMALVQRDSV